MILRSMVRAAAIASLLFACLNITAQSQSAPSPKPVDADDGRDDIFFTVRLTAKELKMDIVPSTSVEFPGTQRRTTLWLTERRNLPDKLEPGVTYRDIGITLRISSRFENIDEIVRAALGEPEPPKDSDPSDQRPKSNPPNNPPPATPEPRPKQPMQR